jgi:two-component system, NtrC family, nitrogen regulation response regulator NtrX
MPSTIFIVDDEKNIRRTVRMVLEGEGFGVEEASSGEEALARLPEVAADVMLLDVQLPGISGLDTIERIAKLKNPESQPTIIMISGHATLADAVRATKAGAYDLIEKPLDRERLMVALRNALERRAMAREVQGLRALADERSEMVGRSQAMMALQAQIAKVAPTRTRVLITGESGTGKELVARAIHRSSAISDKPLVKVNCAAIPKELIESELFGHERGAFTGATARKRGLFEMADGGTIFLDEIGDMVSSAQAKVLRVLQSGEFTRVGGEQTLKVDVRVLAATNRDLQAAVASGEFREDLYFRLNVVPLRAPPLRERGDDVPLLSAAFVELACRENGMKVKTISDEAVALLSAYPWPGNVRELRNVVERAVNRALADPGQAERPLDAIPFDAFASPFRPPAEAAPLRVGTPEPDDAPGDFAGRVRSYEAALLREALATSRFNQRRAAKALGLTYDQLRHYLKKHAIAARP